jgi:mRNA interferase RelE/StbE
MFLLMMFLKNLELKEMNYSVLFEKTAKNDLNKLDSQIRLRVFKFVKRLEECENPKHLGEQLRGNLSKFWKYRIGDYRLICDLDYDKFEISILKISHRKNIYKNK